MEAHLDNPGEPAKCGGHGEFWEGLWAALKELVTEIVTGDSVGGD